MTALTTLPLAAEPAPVEIPHVYCITIFLFTIVLVNWQPKGLGGGWSASLEAVLALIAGVVTLDDTPLVAPSTMPQTHDNGFFTVLRD